jgi:hypothetical protein
MEIVRVDDLVRHNTPIWLPSCEALDSHPVLILLFRNKLERHVLS